MGNRFLRALRTAWAWLTGLFAPEPPLPARVGEPPVLFDWNRDYGPLWEPGSNAIWLEPEAGDIKPGLWPMPFVPPKPVEVPSMTQGLAGLQNAYALRGLMQSGYAQGTYLPNPANQYLSGLRAYHTGKGPYAGILGSLLGL